MDSWLQGTKLISIVISIILVSRYCCVFLLEKVGCPLLERLSIILNAMWSTIVSVRATRT